MGLGRAKRSVSAACCCHSNLRHVLRPSPDPQQLQEACPAR
jgi:hypothetical protein